MSDQIPVQFIKVTFSQRTLNPYHLLAAALPFADEFDDTKTIGPDIRHCLNTEGDATLLWAEVVEPFLASFAHPDAYFGPTEGDASDIGWWPIYDQ